MKPEATLADYPGVRTAPITPAVPSQVLTPLVAMASAPQLWRRNEEAAPVVGGTETSCRVKSYSGLGG